ncbi:MAG: hypothetical protein EXR72_19440 [Myxococcales bacterium]|nr:hypothetical protein [Myxococcales bacterium]
MSLRHFFDQIAPFLDGRIDHPEAVRALWGANPPAPDGERLAIYGRFCRSHRFQAVDFVFEHSRAAVVRLRGEGAWERLVEGYFRAHPMHHVELNENGLALPEYLAKQADLPPWTAELADLDCWDWRTRIAPDAAEDSEGASGPLRLASTVELRPYRHDLVGCIDGPGGEDPRPSATLVLFWRDRDLAAQRENAEPIELAVLKMVAEGIDPEAVAAAVGVPSTRLAATMDDLHAAGILLGARSVDAPRPA